MQLTTTTTGWNVPCAQYNCNLLLEIPDEEDSDGESNRSVKMKIKLKGKNKSTPTRKRKQRKYISDDEDYEED